MKKIYNLIVGLIALVSVVTAAEYNLTDRAVVNGITNKAFLGKWFAYSETSMAICGNMVVSTNEITFSKKGKITFDVIRSNATEYILKISKNIDDGLFMRIATYSRNQIEVGYYATKEDALAERKDRMDYARSWGLYCRDFSPNQQPEFPTKK